MDEIKTEQLIKHHEGLKLFPYNDKTGQTVTIDGNISIAWGRNLSGRPLYMNECDLMMKNDIAYLKEILPKRIIFIESMDDVRQAVLYDMGYNIGLNRLLGFIKMLDDMSRKDYSAAAYELLYSKLHDQAQNRTNNLIGMLNSGNWPEFITKEQQ